VLAAVLAIVGTPSSPLAAQSGDSPVVDALVFVYEDVRTDILEAAQRMPEAEYGFRPSPDVRSFGELVAHVADTQYFFCSAGLGEVNPNEPDHRPNVVAAVSLEARLRAKADIVAAAHAAFAYCDPLYEQTDDQALADEMTLAMAGQPRVRALLLGIYHMARHYGNMVTYMRASGHVPPGTGS
jgi:uncharacterized damage-inducible protein DinB